MTARPDAPGGEGAALLARNVWGVLATADGGAPYAVPVIYGWDGRDIFILMLPGRKERVLRAHPAACLTVIEQSRTEVGASVAVSGAVHFVEDLAGKVRAADVVRRQMAGRRAPSLRDAARLAHARIACLAPRRFTLLPAPAHPFR